MVRRLQNMCKPLELSKVTFGRILLHRQGKHHNGNWVGCGLVLGFQSLMVIYCVNSLWWIMFKIVWNGINSNQVRRCTSIRGGRWVGPPEPNTALPWVNGLGSARAWSTARPVGPYWAKSPRPTARHESSSFLWLIFTWKWMHFKSFLYTYMHTYRKKERKKKRSSELAPYLS